MLVAARVQQTFLPEQSWRGNCTDAYNWGVSGGETGFYTLISITVDNGNMTQSGAMAQCEKYESAWLIEEIMGYSVINLLTSYILAKCHPQGHCFTYRVPVGCLSSLQAFETPYIFYLALCQNEAECYTYHIRPRVNPTP